jgi:hypothetical protein
MVGAFASFDAVTGGRQVARSRASGQKESQSDKNKHGVD